MVPASTIAFERLANRPPTPPKNHDNSDIDEALRFLNVDYTLEDARLDLDHDQSTLPTTSPVQPSSPASSSDKDNKEKSLRRVEFSPCVTAHKPSVFGSNPRGSPLLKKLRSNKELKPLKSILKYSLSQDTPLGTPESLTGSATDYFSVSDPATFPAMLESVVKLLAAPTTSSRLDGYRTINLALKAHEGLVDLGEMKSKMTLFTQFMARDILATDASRKGDVTQANLTTQAIKLATAIILIPALDACLGDDFQNLIIDQSIDVISRDTVSKSIANHHLYLLASQKFSSRTMTPAKAEQLIASLITIQSRVSGNSVINARLVIFQRLLEQAPNVMLTTIRDWLPHVFHGSLSSIRDIRARAVDTGLLAGTKLGSSYQATKAVIDLFNTSCEGSATYGDYFTARLSDMASNKELAPHVPFIWSIVVLFFRSKKSKLATWSLFKKAWLLIIQKCMNSGDHQVKYRAYLAWNRLIYVISPDKETKNSMDGFIQMLKIPIVSAFDKKERDKQAKETRQLAVSGYCHLLHYALRPSLSYEELDIYWDEYVHSILSKLFRSGPRDAALASRVLKALFSNTPKVWREELANDATIMNPEDLVHLDSHWIRSRIDKIFDLLRPHLSAVLSSPGAEISVDKTPWDDLLIAVSEAGSQEVKASAGLKAAVAHLVNFFGRLWKEADNNLAQDPTDVWIVRFGYLIQSAIDHVGALNFSEATLLLNETESFEAAPTPSHRPSKHHNVLQSPVVYLYSLYSQPPSTICPDARYFQVARDMLHKICHAGKSRKARIHLLRQCSEVVKSKAPDSISSCIISGLWSIIAQECARSLLDSDMDQSAQEPQRLGNQIRDAVHILIVGFVHIASGPPVISAWQGLYETATNQLTEDAGEGAVVVGIVEPLAQALLQSAEMMPESVLVQLATTLLGKGTWPKNRQQMEDGRKALWNTSLAHNRNAIFEPFVDVLTLIKTTLQQAYVTLEPCKAHLPSLVTSIDNFLQKSPASHLHSTLRKMQEGLALFVKDDSRLIVSSDDDLRELSVKILALWQNVLKLLRALPSNGTLLKALDSLIAAGLNSSHRTVVNVTVEFWNDTFGKLDSLTYPPAVLLALRRIRPLAELELPTFPDRFDDECPTPLEDFVDSQVVNEMDIVMTPGKTILNHKGKSLLPTAKNSGSFASFGDTPTRNKRLSKQPSSSTPKQSTGRPKTRAQLRHEDSQVQFVAVQSSSPPLSQDESQLLTDRQKEVSSRQRFQTAQLYPDFSSSPAPRSAKAKSRMGRLDFSAQKAVPEDRTTPIPNDEHGLMDDYLVSSPTPKAAEKSRSKLCMSVPADEERGSEALDVTGDSDIPSSPPQMSDIESGSIVRTKSVDRYLDNVPNRGVPVDRIEADAMNVGPNEKIVHTNESENEGETTVDGDTLSIDEEQSQSETGITVPSSHVQESDLYVDATTDVEGLEESELVETKNGSSSPMDFEDSVADLEFALDGSTNAVEDEHPGSSHIEDSVSKAIDEQAQIMVTGEDPSAGSESKASRQAVQVRVKRKRGDDSASEQSSVTSAKRFKPSSPLKRMLSWVTRSQEQTDEGEMLDCIVVASQPEASAGPTETPSLSASAPASTDVPKGKRSRGRPRKSETPVASTPIQTPQTGHLKRDFTEADTGADDKSSVTETPRLAKTRRVTRSQDSAMSPGPTVEVPRTMRRTVIAVVICNNGPAQDEEVGEATNSEASDEGADSQLRLEEEVAVRKDRVIAKPKSIMEKLKSILSDCKTMVLGSQEYRELDDVLFEVRREVHEAASRGRGSPS